MYKRDDKTMIRINLENNTYRLINQQKARYQYKIKEYFKHFGLSKITEINLLDTKKNKILAKSFSINFTKKYKYVRENILLLKSANGMSMIYVSGLNGYGGFNNLENKLKLGE